MTAYPLSQPPALTSLRRRWLLFAFLCTLAAGLGYVFLSARWHPVYAVRWLVLAFGGLAYLLWILWKGLEHNHRIGETQLLATFGAGNNLTLLRGALVAGLVGFLFSPRPEGLLSWIPALLYIFADITDFFDGYLARVTNHATRLGEKLDMSFDGVGVLAAATLAVQYGQVPIWYLSIALARYLFVAGLWLRRRHRLPVYDLPPSISRRAFAGVQMGFIAAVLWPIFTPPGTWIAAALFALPFLAGFLRDWLVVTGFLHSSQPRVDNKLRNWTNRYLPVALRLLVVFFSFGSLLRWFSEYPAQVALFTGKGLPFAPGSVLLLALLEIAVPVMILLGAAGRVTAIAGLLLIGINQFYAGLTTGQAILVVAYTGILFLGTGAISLWTPEDYLIYHRAGEARTPTISSQRS